MKNPRLPIFPGSDRKKSYSERVGHPVVGDEEDLLRLRSSKRETLERMCAAIDKLAAAIQPLLMDYVAYSPAIDMDVVMMQALNPDQLMTKKRTLREDLEALRRLYIPERPEQEGMMIMLRENVAALLDNKKPDAKLAHFFHEYAPKQLSAMVHILHEMAAAPGDKLDFAASPHSEQIIAEIAAADQIAQTQIKPHIKEFCAAAAIYADAGLYEKEKNSIEALGTTKEGAGTLRR